MVSLNEAVKGAVGSVFCAGARGSDWVAGLLSGTPLNNSGIQEAVDRYRAFACGEDVPNDPLDTGSPPSFSGGQCPVSYSVTILADQFFRSDGSYRNTSSNTAVRVGAIGEPYLTSENGFSDVAVKIPEQDGSVVGSVLTLGASVQASRFFGNVRISSITRVDGLPDDCGDLPPSRPEPIEEYEELVDITYDDPLGNSVSIPGVPLKFFKPCINLDGVRLPFEMDLGFAKICGKVGLRPDLVNIVEPAIDIDSCPSQKQDAGISATEASEFFEVLPPFGNPVSFPDAQFSGTKTNTFDGENDKPILGVGIRAIRTGDRSKTVVLQPELATNPNQILPRIGTVFFEYLLQKEDGYETGFSEAIPIQNVDQFIPCPWQFGAVRVHGYSEVGWEVGFYPFARKSCCDSCSKNDPNAGLDNLDRCRID